MFEFNNKKETIKILTEYFKDFDVNELKYYFNNSKNETIPFFLESNIFNPEDIELINLLQEHIKIATSKVFYLTTPLNLSRNPIKLSFITDSIYWEELFVIENTIFISYPYLQRVFEKIEYNEYNSVESIYLGNNKIFDLELLKKIGECLYYVIQFLNFEYWEEFICKKFDCIFEEKSKIKFLNNYSILREPNTSFIKDKITICWLPSNEIYGIFNLICSPPSYSPYWETKIIKLKYSNGEYFEINSTDPDSVNDNIFKNKLYKQYNLQSNPFAIKAKQITDSIIHNK